MKRIFKVSAACLAIGIGALAVWLFAAPPELLRVGSGYAAKIVCSNVFLAHRDANQVLASDVQAPGNPLLRLMRVSVDAGRRQVEAGFFGVIANRQAVYRDGLGCAVPADDGDGHGGHGDLRVEQAVGPATAQPADEASLWPQGRRVEADPQVTAILADDALTGPGLRAVVVVKDGRIVGERYGAGFSSDTPLLGWSMTKTVNAALVGTLIGTGQLALDDSNLLPAWAADSRRDIRLADLLAMQSGLSFNEDYGTVADVTRMLYLTGDMAGFAASLPPEAGPGQAFHYSSGTGVLLSRIWMDRLADPAAALAYPRQALFAPLGMTSAVMEPDAAGTMAGSSYMYATARDWARFGMLLAQGGVWEGRRLLPGAFVGLMQTANAHSNGRYSQAQTWLPKRAGASLPPDTFLMSGHDGQTVGVMPAEKLVVVRLGLTPYRAGFDPILLLGSLAKATGVGP